LDDGVASAGSAGGPRQFPGENEAAVLVYSSDDAFLGAANATTIVNLTLSNLPRGLKPGSGAVAALWMLDNEHGNALRAWEEQGRPLFPTAADFQQMRAASELVMAPGFPRPLDRASVQLQMQTPSVALLHICSSIRTAGAPATALRLHRTPTPGTTIVSWNAIEPDAGRCIAKYDLHLISTAI
jgi:hypothetical protein